MKSEQINELATALAKAQSEITGAKKDANNPFFKSKYADLSSVWEACRDALTKNGLCVSQMVEQNEHGDVLCTMLIHSSGQWLSSTMPIKSKLEARGSNELQALGSALTYLRRFSLAAIVGVAPAEEDDDGNGATNPSYTQKKAFVTTDQVHLLTSTLSKCSPDFRKSFNDYLKSNSISGFANLSSIQYQQIMTQAKIDIQSIPTEVEKNVPQRAE